MSMLKDTRFWIGAAAGLILGPYALKTAQGLLSKVKAKAS